MFYNIRQIFIEKIDLTGIDNQKLIRTKTSVSDDRTYVEAKIKITNVKAKEAIITDPSPQIFRARSVAILAASILTKLFPRRIPPIK